MMSIIGFCSICFPKKKSIIKGEKSIMGLSLGDFLSILCSDQGLDFRKIS